MEIKEMLNENQAEELFDRESVAICGYNAVPETRAAELLGIHSVRAAKLHRNTAPEEKERYGNADRLYREWSLPDGESVRFWLLRGFGLIVTYHNVFLQVEKETAERAERSETDT